MEVAPETPSHRIRAPKQNSNSQSLLWSPHQEKQADHIVCWSTPLTHSSTGTSKSKSTRARERPEHCVCAEHHHADLAASDGLPRRDHVLCRHRSPTQLELYVLTKQPATLEVSVRQLTGVAAPIQPTANVLFHPKCAVNNNFRSCQCGSARPVVLFPIDCLNLFGFTLG